MYKTKPEYISSDGDCVEPLPGSPTSLLHCFHWGHEHNVQPSRILDTGAVLENIMEYLKGITTKISGTWLIFFQLDLFQSANLQLKSRSSNPNQVRVMCSHGVEPENGFCSGGPGSA